MIVFALIVTVILALAVLTFARLMLAERQSANYSLRQKQARLLAESGVHWLRLYLSQDLLTLQDRGDVYDNTEFMGVMVNDGTIPGTGLYDSSSHSQILDPRAVGRFTIIVPAFSDDGSFMGERIRYGLEDESGKLNLHWLMEAEKAYPGIGRLMLTLLPGVTDEIADSIVDWMDPDDEPREFGAESEFYTMMQPPYRPRNDVADSIDELLLVEGVTPQLLYGVDWNRNGLLDMGEPDPETLEKEYGVGDQSLNLGLSTYLTVDSRESQLTPDGYLRIDVNSPDLQTLHEQLVEILENEEWADFIIAYRQYGPPGGATTSALGAAGSVNSVEDAAALAASSAASAASSLTTGAGTAVKTGPISFTKQPEFEIHGLLELVDATTQVVYEGNGSPQTLPSPFTSDVEDMRTNLPLLYDNLMLSSDPKIGRINLNQAPRAVLEVFSLELDPADESVLAVCSSMGVDPLALIAPSEGEEGEEASSDYNTITLFSLLGVPPDQSDLLIQGILDNRIADPARAAMEAPEMQYPFWPYTMGIVEDVEILKKIEPFFCMRGSVYRTQIVGRFDAKSPAVRFEIWLDASLRPAKILRIRELTELGPGYSPEILGIDEYYGGSSERADSVRSGSSRGMSR